MNDYAENKQIISCLEIGDVKGASELLGHLVSVSGVVVRGEGLGTKIGFPTANLETGDHLPASGVYAAFCTVDNNKYKCMVNIGTRPTVSSGQKLSIEVHIFDLNEDLYGKRMTLSFFERLRSEIKFESLAALKRQLTEDKKTILRLLNNY